MSLVADNSLSWRSDCDAVVAVDDAVDEWCCDCCVDVSVEGVAVAGAGLVRIRRIYYLNCSLAHL